MRRRSFLAGVVRVVVAPFAVEAQPVTKVPRIGFLRRGMLYPSGLEAFRQGLRALGYIEGQNVEIVQRYANDVAGRLPTLAGELVRLKVDVIVVDETATARAAKAATTTTPIVFLLTLDPVETGLVGNLGRPGGNLTGLTQLAPELEKRLELLKEVVPGLSRVALLVNPANPTATLESRQFEGTARALGIYVEIFQARDPAEIERAFAAMAEGGMRALIPHGDGLFFGRRARLVELAGANRVPAIYEERSFVEAGGLMAYGASHPKLYRRAATFVDKILKGAKPGDLPIEQSTKFELVVNMKTAKALGLTVPQSLLLRADQVIE